MGLLDQFYARCGKLPANMPRVGFMPLFTEFLRRPAHMLGQHEVPVVQQAGLCCPIGNSPADDSAIRAMGLERQESALLGLRREKMVAVIEEQKLEIGPAHVMKRTRKVRRWVHCSRGRNDGNQMENQPKVYHPAPVWVGLSRILFGRS